MSNTLKFPFKNSKNPKALLYDLMTEEGESMDKVMIVAVMNDGRRVVASSHSDDYFMLLCSALVEDIAKAAVFNEIEEE